MDFFKHWFRGWEKGLLKLDAQQQSCLLGECGRACSESYSLHVYRKIRENAKDIPEFFEKLKDNIPEIGIDEILRGTVYEIRYRKCLCDLYTNGLVKDGVLCECSRRSLLFNLETVFPDRAFDVQLLGSVIRGDGECILRIRIE